MQEAEAEPSEERDINDAFNDIFLVENRVYKEGFADGVIHGEEKGNEDAFNLGYRRGAEIGAEIGYYTGIAESYLWHYEENQSGCDEKIIKQLQVLKKLLEDFPRVNNPEVDIIELLSRVRAKFKKICALLKIRPTFPQPNQLSF